MFCKAIVNLAIHRAVNPRLKLPIEKRFPFKG